MPDKRRLNLFDRLEWVLFLLAASLLSWVIYMALTAAMNSTYWAWSSPVRSASPHWMTALQSSTFGGARHSASSPGAFWSAKSRNIRSSTSLD